MIGGGALCNDGEMVAGRGVPQFGTFRGMTLLESAAKRLPQQRTDRLASGFDV